MSDVIILGIVSALFTGILVVAVAWFERGSVAHWAFVVGMLVLASESVFLSLSVDAMTMNVMTARPMSWPGWCLGDWSRCLFFRVSGSSSV